MKPRLICPTLLLGLNLAASAAEAASLDLNFNYRITPTASAISTIATAHFEDATDAAGRAAVDLRLTNVASNGLPGVGAISYISGLLLSFDYLDGQLPGITVNQFSDDTAQSDSWEPVEDVATVDGFTFTSELGFPRVETNDLKGARLAPGETAHIRFENDGSLPEPLTVAKIAAAVRSAGAPEGAPNLMMAVKVRSIPNLTGGESIESVPTIVVGAALAETQAVSTVKSGLDCGKATPSRAILWPANKALVPVEVRNVTGTKPFRISITGVRQDEPVVNAKAADRTRPDARIKRGRITAKIPNPPDVVLLRAERQTGRNALPAGGNGRVYKVRFRADDGTATCDGEIAVTVPKTKRIPAVDDQGSYDSTGR